MVRFNKREVTIPFRVVGYPPVENLQVIYDAITMAIKANSQDQKVA